MRRRYSGSKRSGRRRPVRRRSARFPVLIDVEWQRISGRRERPWQPTGRSSWRVPCQSWAPCCARTPCHSHLNECTRQTHMLPSCKTCRLMLRAICQCAQFEKCGAQFRNRTSTICKFLTSLRHPLAATWPLTQSSYFVQTLESPGIKLLTFSGLESHGKGHMSWKTPESPGILKQWFWKI